MKIVRWLVAIGLLLSFVYVAPAAHAQYVGGKPPPVGYTDNGGPPTQVQGTQFSQPAQPIVPITKKKESSSDGLLGSLTLGDILTGAGVLAALGLLWFFFLWKRRRDEEDEEGGFPAPA